MTDAEEPSRKNIKLIRAQFAEEVRSLAEAHGPNFPRKELVAEYAARADRDVTTIYKWLTAALKSVPSDVFPTENDAGEPPKRGSKRGVPNQRTEIADGEEIPSKGDVKIISAQFAEEVDALVAKYGPNFQRADLVAKYSAMSGRDSTTIYRWLTAALKSGRPGRALAEQVKKDGPEARASVDDGRIDVLPPAYTQAATGLPRRMLDVASDKIAEDAVRNLPPPPDVDVVAGMPVNGVLIELTKIMRSAEEIMNSQRSEETRRVKNPRIFLMASEHKRRILETYMKLHERIMETMKVQNFHKAVMDILMEADPEMAQKVVKRLDELNDRMGGDA